MRTTITLTLILCCALIFCSTAIAQPIFGIYENYARLSNITTTIDRPYLENWTSYFSGQELSDVFQGINFDWGSRWRLVDDYSNDIWDYFDGPGPDASLYMLGLGSVYTDITDQYRAAQPWELHVSSDPNGVSDVIEIYWNSNADIRMLIQPYMAGTYLGEYNITTTFSFDYDVSINTTGTYLSLANNATQYRWDPDRTNPVQCGTFRAGAYSGSYQDSLTFNRVTYTYEWGEYTEAPPVDPVFGFSLGTAQASWLPVPEPTLGIMALVGLLIKRRK